jgi:predicted transcriptional regulator
LKIQLVVEEKSITLPLQPTDISGKYESAITPTFSGWSQLNFIGKINEQNVNLALHPLKVQEQEVLQFPPVESTNVETGDFEREINDLRGEIRDLQETINELQEQKGEIFMPIIGLSIALGIAGIALGTISLAKKK